MLNKCVMSGTRIFTYHFFYNLRQIFKAVSEDVNCVIHGTKPCTPPVRRITQSRNGLLCASAYSTGQLKPPFMHKITLKVCGSAYAVVLHMPWDISTAMNGLARSSAYASALFRVHINVAAGTDPCSSRYKNVWFRVLLYRSKRTRDKSKHEYRSRTAASCENLKLNLLKTYTLAQ